MRRKCLGLFLVVFIFLAASGIAQTAGQNVLIKTKNGVLLVWNQPGNYFTLEIKGEKIVPSPQNQLWITVDGKFLQLIIAERRQILADAVNKDISGKALLTAHRDWESDYISTTLNAKLKVDSEWVKLSNASDALAWSYNMPHVAEKQTAKIQLYLIVPNRTGILGLNTVVETENTEKGLRQYLIDTMNTLKPSDKPINLEKTREQILKDN